MGVGGGSFNLGKGGGKNNFFFFYLFWAFSFFEIGFLGGPPFFWDNIFGIFF